MGHDSVRDEGRGHAVVPGLREPQGQRLAGRGGLGAFRRGGRGHGGCRVVLRGLRRLPALRQRPHPEEAREGGRRVPEGGVPKAELRLEDRAALRWVVGDATTTATTATTTTATTPTAK